MKHINRFDNFSRVNEGIAYDVEYRGDFEGSHPVERKQVEAWILEEPVKVVSVEGTIDTEDDVLEIKLSNGDILSFSAFMSAGGNNSSKNSAYLTVTPNTGVVGKDKPIKFDIKDDFLKYMEDWGSVVMGVLMCYKDVEPTIARRRTKASL